jgi:hypothetical protein
MGNPNLWTTVSFKIVWRTFLHVYLPVELKFTSRTRMAHVGQFIVLQNLNELDADVILSRGSGGCHHYQCRHSQRGCP